MSYENINFQLEENAKIEEVFFASNSDEVAILITSKKEYVNYIMRLYQLQLNEANNKYEPVKELAAFSFQSESDLLSFLKRLPNMTALEILILLEDQRSYDILN